MAKPLYSTHVVPTAEQIVNGCKVRGITVSAMLRRADCDPAGFWRWKAGKTEPRLATVRRMLQVLNETPVIYTNSILRHDKPD